MQLKWILLSQVGSEKSEDRLNNMDVFFISLRFIEAFFENYVANFIFNPLTPLLTEFLYEIHWSTNLGDSDPNKHTTNSKEHMFNSAFDIKFSESYLHTFIVHIHNTAAWWKVIRMALETVNLLFCTFTP